MIKVATLFVRCDHYDCIAEDEGSQEELKERGWKFYFYGQPDVEDGNVYCKEHAKRVWK